MSNVSRLIHTRQCCCAFCTIFDCNCLLVVYVNAS